MLRTRLPQALVATAALTPFVLTFAVACGGPKPPDTGGVGTSTAPSDSTALTSRPPTGDSTPTVNTVPPSVEIRHNPAWAKCHQDFKAVSGDKDPAADVAAMAKGCADMTKMHQVGDTIKGTTSAEKAPDKFPIKVVGQKCYRVYAFSQNALKDLDLALKDSKNETAGEDSTDDPSPVLLEDGAICFKESGDAQVWVTSGMGQGSYAVQVWSDQ